MDEFVRRSKRPKIDLGTDSQHSAVKEEIPPKKSESKPEPITKAPVAPPDMPAPLPPDKAGKKRRFRLPVPKTKLQWILTSLVMLLLLGGTAAAVYWFIIRDEPVPVTVAPEPEPEPEPEPTTEASVVSGRQIPIGTNNKPIYAVQIENSPEARPQSGLKEADIITEAVAEGGITRFNAIFHDNVPPNIGPVRSLRPYYIDWFLPYDAAIVHAGGSPAALADVKSLGLKDIDSVSSIMRRITSRYSPHNYYTTGQQVFDLMKQRSYTSTVATSLPRKPVEKEENKTDEKTGETATQAPGLPAASIVNLKISSALYNVTFTYNKATNTYSRSQGGAPHVDAESGQQLAPDVVIVPILSKSIDPDRVHTKYGTIGTGKVYVFQDGTVAEGSWTKSARNAQWQIVDSAGKPILLNPGQTWFTIVENGGVSYTP